MDEYPADCRAPDYRFPRGEYGPDPLDGRCCFLVDSLQVRPSGVVADAKLLGGMNQTFTLHQTFSHARLGRCQVVDSRQDLRSRVYLGLWGTDEYNDPRPQTV